MLMMITHEILSLFLFYTCFCRSVKMSLQTDREIRLAFWALSVASVVSIFAPLQGFEPNGVTCILLASIDIVQTVTAKHWKHKTPYGLEAQHNAG